MNVVFGTFIYFLSDFHLILMWNGYIVSRDILVKREEEKDGYK